MSKTIKEIADELGVSKTTIRNKMTEEFRSKWVRTSTANGVQILVISDEGINALKSMVLGGNQTENLGANNVSLESDQFGLNEQFEMELKIKNDQIEKLQKLLDQSQQLLLNEQKKTQAFVELEGTTRVLSKNVSNVFVLDLQYFKTPIVLFIVMFFWETVLACLHEFGHYLAAKLLGVRTNLRVSQRFVLFMVFECKMNGVWLLDKYKRMFPMLGGILMDNLVIFLCSFILSVSKRQIPILFVILFIQYTKMIYHLLIPFRTDLYYLILFRFHGCKNEKAIIFISYLVGYVLLIPLIVVYLIQFVNLALYMKDAPMIQNILVILILLIPILLFVKERMKLND